MINSDTEDAEVKIMEAIIIVPIKLSQGKSCKPKHDSYL